MKLDRYEFKSGDNFFTYEFLSEGPKGKIQKIIQFTLVNQNDLYNLAFGDKNSLSGEIDDVIISDNGIVKKFLQQLLLQFMLFVMNTPRHGFTQPEVQPQEPGFTEWV